MTPLLINVTLSSNVCPKCAEAATQEPMTLAQWQASEWGAPGSSGRYCESDCHCILVDVDVLPDFPEIGKRIKLRGDKETDIDPIIHIHPREETLARLMDLWNAKVGKLPPEIYDMAIDKIAPYLIDKLKELGIEITVRGGVA